MASILKIHHDIKKRDLIPQFPANWIPFHVSDSRTPQRAFIRDLRDSVGGKNYKFGYRGFSGR
ncbi:hypothetical protein G9A89_007245 [Geosiphon pyriformis]|nr:hypothetical protein G9A89_007245 [Geosiphon pyriformis]